MFFNVFKIRGAELEWSGGREGWEPGRWKAEVALGFLCFGIMDISS